MIKHLNLGLFGYGCVGQGLHDVLNSTNGMKANIQKICVKDRTKPRRLPIDRFTFDKNELLNDPGINLVVELIDDADEAFSIVSRAMKNGKSVVTANKKMVAEHLKELVTLQEETGTSLLYEAAVCGSIPIIRNLEEYYDNELLYSIRGIFNGSSNYILSKMYNEKKGFNEAKKVMHNHRVIEVFLKNVLKYEINKPHKKSKHTPGEKVPTYKWVGRFSDPTPFCKENKGYKSQPERTVGSKSSKSEGVPFFEF